jgi:choline monooxygenase
MLTQEELAAIRAPIESARTLPKRAFVDPEFYRFEEEHLIRPSWLAVAFAAELDKGACQPYTVLGVPVLLARDRDGIGRAFHNVCPYDGCEVALSPLSDIDEIVTAYHGWRYALDGRLLQAPYWDGTPDAASVDVADLNADLVPIDCAEWLGTVFVRLTPAGDSFDRYMQPVTDYCADLDLDRLAPGHDEHGQPRIDRLTIRANWKTVYENYSPNVYHESFVHAQYRRSPHTPRVKDGHKTYREVIGDNGFIGLDYDNSVGGSFYPDSPFRLVQDRSGKPSQRNAIINVYPNWALTVLNQYARITINQPVAVDRCEQSIVTYFDGDQATDPDPEMVVHRNRAASGGVVAREEDNAIAESVQRARQSPAFDSHSYSTFWDRPHYALTNLLADRIEAAQANQS